ncbi:anti-sigma factor domain-containing protein [Pseudonocardia yunnanensis]|uniref:Regulator of SigK n=1 Tax=Pseudonocardia yunnanensis TaxID=58107 RepID=A0ABW4EZE6_9PSEU
MNDQAVAWALQALEPDEEQAMRTHLPGCRSCRDMVRETELIMGELATSVEPADPPARLRDNILAAAAETPQARPVETSVAEEPESGGAAAGGAVVRPASRGGARRWTGSRRRLVAAAVAVVAVLGAAGGLVVHNMQGQQRDVQIAQPQTLDGLVGQLQGPGTSRATLSTSTGEAVAAVLVSPSERTVVTAGLPPNNRADTTYVVWGLGTGDPRPLGAFDVLAPGPGVHEVGAVATGPEFSSYAISLEPGRSLPATPTMVVASGAVQT